MKDWIEKRIKEQNAKNIIIFPKENKMESTTKIVKEFQKEVEKMDENDIRLKTIKEWKKNLEKKDHDGIRNYPESCMERMLSDEQVHGI